MEGAEEDVGRLHIGLLGPPVIRHAAVAPHFPTRKAPALLVCAGSRKCRD